MTPPLDFVKPLNTRPKLTPNDALSRQVIVGKLKSTQSPDAQLIFPALPQ